MANGTAPRLMMGVESWCTWEPQGDSSVCTSYRNGEVVQEELSHPNLDSIAPMQRRRLSPMSRVAFHVLSQCMSSDTQEPLIFSSVMGEIRRTQGILDSLAVNAAVSPAAFSLSVHNSVAGLWSLIHGNKMPMLSLAPVDSSPIPALLEAAGALAEGHCNSVLVVYCEEEYPDFYRPFMVGPAAPTATALRLVLAGEQHGDLVLSLEQGGIENYGNAADNPRFLTRLLHQQMHHVTVVEPQSIWQLAVSG